MAFDEGKLKIEKRAYSPVERAIARKLVCAS